MHLSVSLRAAEPPRDKTTLLLPFEDILDVTADCGAEAICVRPSLVSVGSDPGSIAGIAAAIARRGLRISMVTSDVRVAANTPDAGAMLQDIQPHLSLAAQLGCGRLRVAVQTEKDLAGFGHAAALAKTSSITLAHQIHWGTYFDTTGNALGTLTRIRPAQLDLVFEPANILFSGETDIEGSLTRLLPHIGNVYLSNARLGDRGLLTVPSNPSARFDYVPLDDESGIDISLLVQCLRKAKYNGWITLHQPALSTRSVADDIAAAISTIRSAWA